MYTGTLIEQLIATVKLAEERVREQEAAPAEGRPEWYTVAPYELSAVEPGLQGVA
jgi:hypothetical protein